MNLGIRPTLTQAPAPASTEAFDLARIDTPAEAMLMPIVDLVAGMVASNGDTPSVATVKVEAGGQRLEYVMRPQADATVSIDGKMNDVAFQLAGSAQPDKMQATVAGDTPGGRVQTVLEAFPGGFKVSGQAGDVSFEETLTLNPFGGLTGDIASIEGTVGGEALAESLKLAEDGQSLLVTGTLGSRAINETVSMGPNGTVRVSGTIGALTVEETIEKA